MRYSVKLGAAVVVLGACFACQAEGLKIGVSGPFSGSSSAMGISMRNGARLAVEEINAGGGVLDKHLELVERDDHADNAEGARIARELIGKDKVIATVGFVNTGVALASQRYYEDAQIPVMNAVATGSVLTQQFVGPTYADNYVFRNSASDVIQSSMIVEDAIVKQKRLKVAILTDNTDYGRLGRGDLERELLARGIHPVSVEHYQLNDSDMKSQLTRAKNAGADILLTYGIGPDLAQIANDMQAIHWQVPIVGSWTLAMSSFIQPAGDNSNGAHMPQTFIANPTIERNRTFLESYARDNHNEAPGSAVSAAQAYDAVYLLAAAIRQAGTTEGPQIRAALENLNEKVAGVITVYDKPYSHYNHEAIKPAIVKMGEIVNGKVVPETSAR